MSLNKIIKEKSDGFSKKNKTGFKLNMTSHGKHDLAFVQ